MRTLILCVGLVGSIAPASAQVVGGADAPVGAWEDAAGVVFRGGGVGCTGTLVAPNVVLTAGHCIGGIDGVMLATHDLRSPGEVIDVAQEIEYPSSFRSYDAGVLVLASDATVEPRVIASGCAREKYIVDGAEVAIVGYGAIDPSGSQYTDILQEARSTIVDADCSPAQNGCNDGVSPGGELIAGGMGIDSCFGDSGGPLYLITPRGDFLVGITSRGTESGGSNCGQGGVYVRPDAIVEWIEMVSGASLPEPVCNFAPEPAGLAIEVEAGESESVVIEPNDADAGDTHTFAVSAEPEHGSVDVAADGTATYTADGDYEGEDSFAIAVTDDGDPARTADAVVAVTVLPGGGCGCRTAGSGPGVAWLAALVLVGLRRRRR